MTFYISEFVCGILITVIVEVIGIFIYGTYKMRKDKKNNEGISVESKDNID